MGESKSFLWFPKNGRERIEIWGGQPGAIPLVLLLERGMFVIYINQCYVKTRRKYVNGKYENK